MAQPMGLCTVVAFRLFWFVFWVVNKRFRLGLANSIGSEQARTYVSGDALDNKWELIQGSTLFDDLGFGFGPV